MTHLSVDGLLNHTRRCEIGPRGNLEGRGWGDGGGDGGGGGVGGGTTRSTSCEMLGACGLVFFTGEEHANAPHVSV